MSTNGLSIFQGGGPIQVNTSLERLEEEALEDQKRRHEELGNLLQNAFDDLEDDESTIDSTTNFQSDLIDQPVLIIRDDVGNQDHVVSEAEIHRLKVTLESRSREFEHCQKLLNDEYNKTDELKKRLAIAETELDRTLATKNNTHELLVESKEKCSNLENTINKMRAERKTLEAENNSLLGKLETCQTLLADVQRKYDMVERDQNKHNEHNAELKRKQMEDRHRAELELLKQQMEQTADKFDKKANELESMNARYQALQSSHEIMICDKASKINDLSRALDAAQKRYEDLLARPDYYQENVNLQKLVTRLEEQIVVMERTIKGLKERLDATTAELDVMDSLLHQHNQEDSPRPLSQVQGGLIGSTPLNTVERVGSLKDELYRALANLKAKRDEVRKLQQTLQEKHAEINSLRQEENENLVQINTLKEENIRMENRFKILQEEYESLKNAQQQRQDNQGECLKKDLQNLQTQYEALKTEKDLLNEEKAQQEKELKCLDASLKNVQVDLEELRQEHESLKRNYEQLLSENKNLQRNSTTDSMCMELEKHKLLLKDAQSERDRLKNLYVEISNAKGALNFELQKFLKSDQTKELQEEKEKVANLQRSLQLMEVKTSELAKILETEKLCHERELSTLRDKMEKAHSESKKEELNGCAKCMDYVAEITKFEIQNLKLINVNSVSKKEIDDLTQELEASKAHIAELNEQLKLSKQQEILIKELKIKATQFEEYIKSQSSSSEQSPPPHTNHPKRQFSDKSVVTSPELERSEIKRIEARLRDEMAKIFVTKLKKFQIKIQQTLEQNQILQREYEYMNVELQQRKLEVDLLKQAALAERQEMNEILKHKTDECNKMLEKQSILLQEFREELHAKKQKIKDILRESTERQAQIEAERQSMKAVMKQWEEQRKIVDDVEQEWKNKFKELQEAHQTIIESWKSKHRSAEKIARNYKRYSEDKEAHMLKEYDRLKRDYDIQVAQIKREAYLKAQNHHQVCESVDRRVLSTNNNNNNSKNKENNNSN
ncbi:chromosome segregation ATPase asterless isoform 1-T1 [Glossina fuscipes fuscipes]